MEAITREVVLRGIQILTAPDRGREQVIDYTGRLDITLPSTSHPLPQPQQPIRLRRKGQRCRK